MLTLHVTVLSLIEAFAKGKRAVRRLDAEVAGAHDAHERTLTDFRALADEWIERERQYKAEIKRLEVVLSRTSREGVAAVTLARANSIVDRNGPRAKKFTSELKRLSDHKTGGMYCPSIPPLPPLLQNTQRVMLRPPI